MPSLSASGFDWDEHNLGKCERHGVSRSEIEALFEDGLQVFPDLVHSAQEERFLGIGRSRAGRHIFLAFTMRLIGSAQCVRLISARYMHAKEVKRYEEANSLIRQ